MTTSNDPVSWAANWYKTRRHIVMGEHALCSQYTSVWKHGHVSWEASFTVPAADTPEVMALPMCMLCERKRLAAAKRAAS